MTAETTELEAWLAAGYETAYRTAWLILRDRADAEEAVHEAFLRAWRFRDAIPDGGGDGRWLYRVVVTTCLSKLRRERRHRERTASRDGGTDADADADRAGLAVRGEARDALLAAVGRLPAHLRVVVVLRYGAGLQQRDIARVIRRRPGTVKGHVDEARSRLAADAVLTDRVQDFDPMEAIR